MGLRGKGLLALAFTLAFFATTLVTWETLFPARTVLVAATVEEDPLVSPSSPAPSSEIAQEVVSRTSLRASLTTVKAVHQAGLQAERQAARKAKREAKLEKLRKERARQKRIRERKAARQAYLASLITTTNGILGGLTHSKTEGVQGNVTTAVANIPGRTSHEGWVKSMRLLRKGKPDFILLNEVFNRPTEEILRLAPGYSIVRGQPDFTPGGRGQSVNNVILYQTSKWESLASGMVKVVNDDRPYYSGRKPLWDRYATWALLKGNDGEVLSVFSTHMPTNPGKYPKQWGQNALSRVQLYAKGMGTIRAMVDQLSAYGPVLVGGDMNSHAGQGDWTAVAQLGAEGYLYTKDRGVMYLFHQSPATVVRTGEIPVVSDHPALLTTLAMNGWGPRA